MNTIQSGDLPKQALLAKYQADGAFTDCYFIDFPQAVSHAEFVAAFYTTPLFKVERCILALLARKPSSDLDVQRLASGEGNRFAAWQVEDRTPNQLLLCDFMGRTRSWLMTVAPEGGTPGATRLFFGSAVIPRRDLASGRVSLGWGFHALLGFHRAYSRALLRAACARLSK